MFDFNEEQYVAFKTEEFEYVKSYIHEVINFGEINKVDTHIFIDNQEDFEFIVENIDMILKLKNTYVRCDDDEESVEYIYDGVCISIIKKENIFLNNVLDNKNTLFYNCAMNVAALTSKNLIGKVTFINNKINTPTIPLIKKYKED